jgi:hypothetical protein
MEWNVIMVVAFGSLVVGLLLGFGIGCEKTERKAIDAGVAYYEHSPTAIMGKFKFKTFKE